MKGHLANSPTLTMMRRIEEVHAFFRTRSRAQMLATAAPFNTPWLPAGYGQKLWRAEVVEGCLACKSVTTSIPYRLCPPSAEIAAPRPESHVAQSRASSAPAMSGPSISTALLLAGPSSVGKTTLAAALQRTLSEPWVFLPADVLTDGFPPGRREFISVEVDRRLRQAALLALTAFIDAGFNVIGEAYIWDPGMRELAASVFRGRGGIRRQAPLRAPHPRAARGRSVRNYSYRGEFQQR